MSTVIKGANGSNVVLLKGAPERILEKCNGVVNSNDQVVAFKSYNEKKELLNKLSRRPPRDSVFWASRSPRMAAR